jgi:hypothetical protein
MSTKSKSSSLGNLTSSFGEFGHKAWSYRAFAFFLFVAAFYGFIVWRINVYSNALPSQSETAARTTPQPHIDKDTVEKLQSLQDNSQSVQSLFDTARQNPFQE